MSGSIENEIRGLAHWASWPCSCGRQLRVHALQLCVSCPACGIRHKCGLSHGRAQFVIDAVLSWIQEGDDFEAAMLRREEVRKDEPQDWPDWASKTAPMLETRAKQVEVRDDELE